MDPILGQRCRVTFEGIWCGRQTKPEAAAMVSVKEAPFPVVIPLDSAIIEPLPDKPIEVTKRVSSVRNSDPANRAVALEAAVRCSREGTTHNDTLMLAKEFLAFLEGKEP